MQSARTLPSLHVSISVMFTHSCLSFSVSLSFRAIHIQYNNPYKRLFLFMSLSSSRCSSTHENVNTENGLPWGGFMHHTCEQKVHAHLLDSAFVRAPHCHPWTSYYIHISVKTSGHVLVLTI